MSMYVANMNNFREWKNRMIIRVTLVTIFLKILKSQSNKVKIPKHEKYKRKTT